MSFESEHQISQMIAFIMQEAKEKAEEIRVKTDKEFMAERLTLEQQKSNEIRVEHEKTKKQWFINQRIQKSQRVTDATFQKMKRRDEKMNDLKRDILLKLADVSKSKDYSQLLRFLIAQGLLTIQEQAVEIQCREEDLALVKAELSEATKLFQKTVANVTGGFSPSVNISLNETEFLPKAPVKGEMRPSCAGGIIVSAKKRTILCRNTLDARLDLAFEQLKPTIRALLFGVRDAPKNAGKGSSHKH